METRNDETVQSVNGIEGVLFSRKAVVLLGLLAAQVLSAVALEYPRDKLALQDIATTELTNAVTSLSGTNLLLWATSKGEGNSRIACVFVFLDRSSTSEVTNDTDIVSRADYYGVAVLCNGAVPPHGIHLGWMQWRTDIRTGEVRGDGKRGHMLKGYSGSSWIKWRGYMPEDGWPR